MDIVAQWVPRLLDQAVTRRPPRRPPQRPAYGVHAAAAPCVFFFFFFSPHPRSHDARARRLSTKSSPCTTAHLPAMPSNSATPKDQAPRRAGPDGLGMPRHHRRPPAVTPPPRPMAALADQLPLHPPLPAAGNWLYRLGHAQHRPWPRRPSTSSSPNHTRASMNGPTYAERSRRTAVRSRRVALVAWSGLPAAAPVQPRTGLPPGHRVAAPTSTARTCSGPPPRNRRPPSLRIPQPSTPERPHDGTSPPGPRQGQPSPRSPRASPGRSQGVNAGQS